MRYRTKKIPISYQQVWAGVNGALNLDSVKIIIEDNSGKNTYIKKDGRWELQYKEFYSEGYGEIDEGLHDISRIIPPIRD